MIVYTLLLSYQDKDIVSIMLTSFVIYIIVYNLLTIKYNYIILALVSVADIYMSKDMFKKRQTIKPKKTTKEYRSKLCKPHKHNKHNKHVTFADTPQYYSHNQHTQQSSQTYDTNTPAYRLWLVEQQQQAQQQQQLQLDHHQLLQTQEQMQKVQQNQMQQYDTDSNGSTNTDNSIVSSELTYSSEDLS